MYLFSEWLVIGKIFLIFLCHTITVHLFIYLITSLVEIDARFFRDFEDKLLC